jgi:hypothetical protein
MNKDDFDKLPQEKRIDILIKWFGIRPLFYTMISTKEGYDHLLKEVEK